MRSSYGRNNSYKGSYSIGSMKDISGSAKPPVPER